MMSGLRTTQRYTVFATVLAAVLIALATGRTASAQVTTAEQQQFVFAYRLLQNGDTKGSAEAFDKYIDAFPGGKHYGDALYFRALLAWQSGKPKDAAGFLGKIQKLDAVPMHRLLFLRGRVSVELGQYEQALESLEKVPVDDLKPAEHAAVLFERGLAYKGAKNLTAAASQLEAAGKQDTSIKDRALLELARVQALQDKPNEAVATLTRCLALAGTTVAADAARLAGDLSFTDGRYDKAIEFYNTVLTRHQTSPHFQPVVVQMLWSQLYAANHQILLAMFDQYKTKLKSIDDRAVAWFLAGRSHQYLGQFSEAIKLFKTVTSALPGSVIEDQILYRMAECQFDQGEHEAMAKTLDKLRQSHPSSKYNASGDFLRAKSDARQGKVDDAAAKLTAIIDRGDKHPHHLAALDERARLYWDHNKLDAAAEDYQKYLELGSKPDAGVSATKLQKTALKLQDVYYAAGRFKDARTVTERLLNTSNLPPLIEQEAMFDRALSLILLEQFNEAAKVFDALMAKHPQNAFVGRVHYYRGLMLMASQPTDAIKHLESAVADTKLPEDLRANALLLVSIHQREGKQAKAAADTLKALEKTIGLNRMRDIDLLWLGNHYKGTDARMVFHFVGPLIDGKRKVSDPVKTEALYLVGLGLEQVGKLDVAIATFREVEALGHGFGLLARLEVARSQAKLGKLRESLDSYRGLMIARDSSLAATALFESARVLRTRGDNVRAVDKDGAAKDYKAAYDLLYRLTVLFSFKELSPLPQLAHIERAELAPQVDKPGDVAKSLAELQERFPDGPYAVYARAMVHLDRKETTEAATLLRKLRQQTLDPRLADRVNRKLNQLESGQ